MRDIKRISLIVTPFLAAMSFGHLGAAALDSKVTCMDQVMPTQARPGEVVTVTGYALAAAHVKDIYLTTGEIDFRVEILEQSDTAVRLRVPAKIPSGQMRFALIVASRPEILEQPVFLKILPAVG
jgi:hypothetical protein